MFPVFPADDARQTVRLQRFFLAAGCYLLWMAFGVGMYYAGLLDLPSNMLVPIVSGVALTNLYFYAFIRSGLNLRFADPSLTFSQILVAMSWILVLMFAAAESRGPLLSVYVMSLLFGVFQLRRRDFMLLAVFGLVGYLTLVGMDLSFFPDRVDRRLEFLRSSVLVGTLLWAAVFGSHVSKLRARLHDRNDALRDALDEVHHASRHDHLTQVFNRRYVMQTMQAEKERADRHQRPFAVIILDLDHFKIINDRYGHLAGDRVLMAFSERTKGTLRGMDCVGTDSAGTFGRYGGEEFIVLLPETDLGGAYRCAERIRRVTEDEPFDDVFSVTVSAGVAEYRLNESIEDTLRRADAALYRAKEAGRNRIVADDTSTSGIYRALMRKSGGDKVVIGQFRP